MGTPISNFPTAGELLDNHLIIVESQGTGATTQKTTLLDIYNWFNNGSHTYNIKLEQIKVAGVNLTKLVNNADNSVTINYTIPEWANNTTYTIGDLVRYRGCLYICSAETTTVPSNNSYWYPIGYTIGRHLTLDENNVLSGMGIDKWAASTTYFVDDFVVNNKRLYRCKVENSDATWDEDHWDNIGEGNGILVFQGGKTYDNGAIVIYNNKLYKRTANTGTDIDWVDSNWFCISNGDYAQTFIKYSHTNPTSNADLKSTPDEYIGIYVGRSETAPINYGEYTWYKIKGEDGTNGYVNVEANMAIINITLLAENWSESAPYSQTISNNNLTSAMYPFIDVVLSNNEEDWEDELKDYSSVTKATCNNGSITFYCKDSAPTQDINLILRISGDMEGSNYVTQTEFNTFKTQMLSITNNLNTLLQNTLEGN